MERTRACRCLSKLCHPRSYLTCVIPSLLSNLPSSFTAAPNQALKAYVETKRLESRRVSTACLDAQDRTEGITATIILWRDGVSV
eukprot:935669-Rhodomonas_salina.2